LKSDKRSEKTDLSIWAAVRLVCPHFKVAKVVGIRYFAHGRNFEEGQVRTGFVRGVEGYRMNSTGIPMKWPLLVGIGFAAGVAIAVVENFAFDGEVSPILIVAILFVTTAIAGVIWGRRGWIVSAAGWMCVPFSHLIKHILDLPDTLHPNTYASIAMLAAFTFVVAAIGTGCGVLLRRLAPEDAKDGL